MPPSAYKEETFSLNVKNDKENYSIAFGYISESQRNVMGISYCEAYPHDGARCQIIQVAGTKATIEWGLEENNQKKAFVWIPHPKGGLVTLELKPVTLSTKATLNLLLSTFRFLDDNEQCLFSILRKQMKN